MHCCSVVERIVSRVTPTAFAPAVSVAALCSVAWAESGGVICSRYAPGAGPVPMLHVPLGAVVACASGVAVRNTTPAGYTVTAAPAIAAGEGEASSVTVPLREEPSAGGGAAPAPPPAPPPPQP